MKKIILALALVASVQVANAQIKSDADIQKAIDKAEAAANDAKKGAKPATWMKLGQAYVNAYNNPTANVQVGVDKKTFTLMTGTPVVNTEMVTIGEDTLEKLALSHSNVYFNQAGMLVLIDVTKPSIAGDPLAKALDAYTKAFQLGAKEKEVVEAVQKIKNSYYSDAETAYNLGDMKKASDLFSKAAEASMTAPLSVIDTNAVYNTAFTALRAGDFSTAKPYYKKCLDMGYAAEGSVYSALSNCALAERDTTAAEQYLVDGFTLYPDNESVLTGLINLYLAKNEDPRKIINLLDEAKVKMPNNPSLYFVEGNLLVKLSEFDEALAVYRKAMEINPDYEYSYYGEGNTWLEKRSKLLDEANELPVTAYKEYDAKMEESVQCLKNAITPFETCYAKSSDPQVQSSTAQLLKQIYYMLRNESAEYMAAYEKYNAIVGGE